MIYSNNVIIKLTLLFYTQNHERTERHNSTEANFKQFKALGRDYRIIYEVMAVDHAELHVSLLVAYNSYEQLFLTL